MESGYPSENLSRTQALVNMLPAAGLFLLNIVVKSWFLGTRDIAMDEPFTIFHAQGSLPEIFAMLRTENNPPLFFLILDYWIRLFGIGAVSVRFLPMVFSSLTAVFIYLTGKRFFSMRAAIVASLLFTFSNFNLVFAHEARVYSLFTLLTVVSVYLLFAQHEKQSRAKVVLLAVVNSLLLYAHFFGAVVIFTELLMMLAIPGSGKRGLKWFAVSLGVTLLLYLPYLPLMLGRFGAATHRGTWVGKPVISDLYTMVRRYCNEPVPAVILLILVATGTGYDIVRRLRDKIPAGWYTRSVYTWFFVPYLGMFLVSFLIPVFLDRYTVFISIGFYLLAGVSADRLSRSEWAGLLIPACAVAVMLFTFNPNTDNKRRFREAVATIRTLKSGRALVIICPPWLGYGFAYHYDPAVFMDYHAMNTRLNADRIYPVSNASMIGTRLLEGAGSVIYFEEWASIADPDNSIGAALGKSFVQTREVKIYESFMIHEYHRRK